MAAKQFNLNQDQLAERKLLITCVEWKETVGTTQETFREILGKRTPDSSIDYNPDMETSTDILGITYTDMNKTEPQQSFDPFMVMGGSRLGALLNDIRRRNAYTELNQFTVYVITAFIGDSSNGYEAEKHENCTIEYQSMGGDSRVNFPIVLHFSNSAAGKGQPQTGKVDKLSDDFVFTPDVSI